MSKMNEREREREREVKRDRQIGRGEKRQIDRESETCESILKYVHISFRWHIDFEILHYFSNISMQGGSMYSTETENIVKFNLCLGGKTVKISIHLSIFVKSNIQIIHVCLTFICMLPSLI